MMSSNVPISLRDPFWDDPYFSSSRQDFEDMRRRMMRDAKDFWTRVDDRSINDGFDGGHSRLTSSASDFESSSRSPRMESYNWNPATSVPRWFMRPRANDTVSTSTTMSSGFGGDSQVLRVRDDDEKFEITLDVQNFKPEELKVRTQPDNTILVEGKHENRSEDKSGSRDSNRMSHNFSSVLQQFSRRFTLPADCETLRVVSNLSRDGVLVITAPKTKRQRITDRNHDIPIRR